MHFKKENVKRLILVIMGSLIYAIGVNMFLIPHKLLSGGVAGIAIMLQYLTNIQSGYYILLINIPIFLIAFKEVDLDFGIFSFVGMISMSSFLILTRNYMDFYAMNDILISCICGGVLSGAGMGLIFRNRASQGGTDVISVLVKRKFGIKISTIDFMINCVIVTIGALIGSFEVAVYTMISMFVKSQVMGKVIEGFDGKKILFVVTDHDAEIKKQLVERLGVGATIMYGEGAYSGAKRKIIYCIMTTQQIVKAKKIIEDFDEHALISVSNTTECQGGGFKAAAF
ncbi:YitT family protein [Clostridium botulinum]|uniref:YitT family protein n=1 Tax=Clostridium botulinum TaxID=1491 RepID=UPI001C9A951C|nr:YitT family protein [Clostridium botulinum]MBY6797115.1 YitT family protein [Clostridium botulinum]MBY6866463.1 YitT family protein [Clostridium botulinum]